MKVNNFINKYYNEFGDRCPFKCTDMVSDEQKLRKEFSSKLKGDIPLLCRFFNSKIDDLMSAENKFTDNEIEQLKLLDHFWDIPKINFIYTIQSTKIKYENIFLKAIDYNSIYVLEWINNIHSWRKSNIIYYKAETMSYLPFNYASNKYNTSIFTYAADQGKLPIMKWLLENKFQWDEDTFSAAAENGNLSNMKWLLEHKCPINEFTFAFAAKNGNLENMKWLFENKCPFNEYTMIDAIKNGNMENLNWLLEKGCPLHVDVFSEAALVGDLKILKWLKEHNCPWDSHVLIDAAHNGNIENIKWLLDNDCPWHSYNVQKIKNLRVIEWLNNNGYIKKDIVTDDRNIQWLLENGCSPKVVKILNIVLQRNEYY